jgi:hypothetical protein
LLSLAFDALVSRVPATRLIVVLAFGLVALHNVAILNNTKASEAAREQQIKGQLLATARLLDDGEPLLGQNPEPVYSPDITIDRLRPAVRRGWLPDDEVAATDLLSARALLQTTLQPAGGALGSQPILSVAQARLEAADEPSCVTVTPLAPGPKIVIDAGSSPVRLRLVSQAGGTLVVALSDGTQEGRPVSYPLAAGTPSDVVSVARDSDLALTLPDGRETTVCGIAPLD